MNQNNIVKESVPFVKDKRHGIAKTFSEKGNLLRECPYLNDKKNVENLWRKEKLSDWGEEDE